MNWDRIQSLELELAQLRVRVHRMDDINQHLADELREVTRQRDTARNLVIRLWDELECGAHE